jgi:tRNA/tmRNA/rRNA uracil-C5-methylase (TrmA/RlmC/RlmD family)
MRTLLKVTMDVAASNKAILDGSLPKMIQSTMERLKPEASYFTAMDGCRSCFIVFDMKDPSEIPVIAEPFFLNLNAKVEFSPVMNAEDLKKGLDVIQSMQNK